ncbi:MAG: hypothetical protein WCG10_06860 [Chlamydiota bacterium]
MSPISHYTPKNLPSTLVAAITGACSIGGLAYYVGSSGINCIKNIATQKASLFGASFLGYKGAHLELDWTDTLPGKNLICYTFNKTCDPTYQHHINVMKASELINPNLFYKLTQQDINQQLSSLVSSFDPSNTSWFSLSNWGNWLMEKFIEANQHKSNYECKKFEVLTSATLIIGSALIAYKVVPMVSNLYQNYRK